MVFVIKIHAKCFCLLELNVLAKLVPSITFYQAMQSQFMIIFKNTLLATVPKTNFTTFFILLTLRLV